MVDTKGVDYNADIESLYDLGPSHRWQVYFNAANSLKRGFMEKMNDLLVSILNDINVNKKT